MQKLMHGLRFKGFDLSTKSKIPEKHTTFERPFLRIRTLYFPAAISSNPNASEMQKPMILKHGLKFEGFNLSTKSKIPEKLITFQQPFLWILTLYFPVAISSNPNASEMQKPMILKHGLKFKGFDLSTKSKIPEKLITFQRPFLRILTLLKCKNRW